MNLLETTLSSFLLFLLVPAYAAIFRLIFILFYGKKKNPTGEIKKWRECFRYGFWWGMDVHAYLFLWLFIISLGFYIASFIITGINLTNVLNTTLITVTLAFIVILYTAFLGKMIFYFHFHDIYNPTIWLGGNADKKNLADIFFRQNHGTWLLLSYVPILLVSYLIGNSILVNVHLNLNINPILITLAAVATFYFFRFGGTFLHRNKPEWDEVPSVVKDDPFMAKATIDDLVNLKLLLKRRLPEELKHTDEESANIITTIFSSIHSFKNDLPPYPTSEKTLPPYPPSKRGAEEHPSSSDGEESPPLRGGTAAKRQGGVANESFAENLKLSAKTFVGGNPLTIFKRTAKGSPIKPPQNIFLIIAESYGEAPLDYIYSNLNMAPYGKKLRAEKHSVSFKHTLPGGLISQTSLVSLMSGIFDCRMELNEKKAFWEKAAITSLALQLQKFNIVTNFFYGGSLSWGSLMHYLPACGVTNVYDGIKISPENAGRTWLGVYDHIFLESAASVIENFKSASPTLHILYTTSNHGPYRLPLEDYGFDKAKVFGNIPKELYDDAAEIRKMGAFWYQDKAVFEFIERMRNLDPNAMFIVTGDHTVGLIPYGKGVARAEPTLRERLMTSLLLMHPELDNSMFPNKIATHMNLQSTLLEILAPKGGEYFSIYPSLFEPLPAIVTPFAALTNDEVAHYAENRVEELTDGTSAAFPAQKKGGVFTNERAALTELTYMTMRHEEFMV
ncbi:MAG: sulfatase-like hydrolase/transferase [Selenomonadaceae bacterium]|nr:sulfatase-like hydrolase/transferase [Selenomonadaceae bacterium]